MLTNGKTKKRPYYWIKREGEKVFFARTLGPHLNKAGLPCRERRKVDKEADKARFGRCRKQYEVIIRKLRRDERYKGRHPKYRIWAALKKLSSRCKGNTPYIHCWKQVGRPGTCFDVCRIPEVLSRTKN